MVIRGADRPSRSSAGSPRCGTASISFQYPDAVTPWASSSCSRGRDHGHHPCRRRGSPAPITTPTYVVAHFHLCDNPRRVFGIFRGHLHWIGKMFEAGSIPRCGQDHFWTFFIGTNLDVLPEHFLGRQGMPRRYIDYPRCLRLWNYVSSIGPSSPSVLPAVHRDSGLTRSSRAARSPNPAYWGEHADTLEWTLPNPRPDTRFEGFRRARNWIVTASLTDRHAFHLDARRGPGPSGPRSVIGHGMPRLAP